MSSHTPHPQYADAQRLMRLFRRWQIERRERSLPSSQAEAASKLGFGQSALSQYLRGDIPLNVNALRKFCELLEVEPAKISPSLAETMREIAFALKGSINTPVGGVVASGEVTVGPTLIHYYAPRGKLSKKRIQFADSSLGAAAKEATFFAKYSITAQDIIAVVAEGNSNADYIVDGDICFFDGRKTEPETGKLYLIEHPDGLLIKTLRRLLDGSWVLENRNPDKARYPDEIVPAGQKDLLRLCGQFFYRQGG